MFIMRFSRIKSVFFCDSILNICKTIEVNKMLTLQVNFFIFFQTENHSYILILWQKVFYEAGKSITFFAQFSYVFHQAESNCGLLSKTEKNSLLRITIFFFNQFLNIWTLSFSSTILTANISASVLPLRYDVSLFCYSYQHKRNTCFLVFLRLSTYQNTRTNIGII